MIFDIADLPHTRVQSPNNTNRYFTVALSEHHEGTDTQSEHERYGLWSSLQGTHLLVMPWQDHPAFAMFTRYRRERVRRGHMPERKMRRIR